MAVYGKVFSPTGQMNEFLRILTYIAAVPLSLILAVHISFQIKGKLNVLRHTVVVVGKVVNFTPFLTLVNMLKLLHIL